MQKIEKAEIVFAGFGITAAELNYNDYAGKYTKNQVAIVSAGTPDGDNPHGHSRVQAKFAGKWPPLAMPAQERSLIIASENNFKDDSCRNSAMTTPVKRIFRYWSFRGKRRLRFWPVQIHPFENLEQRRQSQSCGKSECLPLKEMTLDITTDVVRNEVPAYNVIGVLEGSDPVLKNEHIIIGAHYDHLGRGGEGKSCAAFRRDSSRR